MSPSFREITTDALRYWERRRWVYNGVLTLVVVWRVAGLMSNGITPSLFHFLPIGFVLAVIANVLYSVVYLLEVFIQSSDYREIWRQWRWILFVIGLLMASILTLGMVPVV